MSSIIPVQYRSFIKRTGQILVLYKNTGQLPVVFKGAVFKRYFTMDRYRTETTGTVKGPERYGWKTTGTVKDRNGIDGKTNTAAAYAIGELA